MSFTYGDITGNNSINSTDKITVGLKIAKIIKDIPNSLELFREHHFGLASYVLDISHEYGLFSYSTGANPKFLLLENKQREIEDIIKVSGRADQLWFDIL